MRKQGNNQTIKLRKKGNKTDAKQGNKTDAIKFE